MFKRPQTVEIARIILREKKASISEIREQMDYNRFGNVPTFCNITRNIDYMIDLGLVDKVRKGKYTQITLTPKGELVARLL